MQDTNSNVVQHEGKVGAKNWLLIWKLGMAGQLCWCVENTWFANYLYAEFGYFVGIVTLMTIFSALATTFSTFFFGTWSDRLGTRKPFIAFGYIAWGIFTIVFGLTNIYAGSIKASANPVLWAGIVVVLTDTVMSFFGSAGNDSGFNAWCSDMLNDRNRGQIGMALASQPVLGTLIGTVLGGAVIEMAVFTNNGTNVGGGFMAFFVIMGVFVILAGVLALFTVKDVQRLQPVKKGTFWQHFATAFNFREFIKRKELLWINITVTVYFIGFNCYFVHIMNWLTYTLGFDAGASGLILGIPLIIAVLCTVPLIALINRNKSPLVATVAIIMAVVGCLVVYFGVGNGNTLNRTNWLSPQNWAVFIGILLVGIGYVASMQTYMVWQKKLYPDDQRGQFEGIRILFFVLFPMVAGPLIANPIIRATGSVENMVLYGREIEQHLPTKALFLAAAIITLFALVPLYFAVRQHNIRLGLGKYKQPQDISQ
ncbi:MAG: MFS transporter [Clostridia bacterium]|nr:MFS transporter [Clostridia bacterium]